MIEIIEVIIFLVCSIILFLKYTQLYDEVHELKRQINDK